MRVLKGRETLLKEITSALLSQLLGDLTARIDEDVSHVAARILVAGNDKVPGITRIGMSTWGREGHRIPQGITEDEERLPCRQRVDELEVRARSTPAVHVAGVAPNGTAMIMRGH